MNERTHQNYKKRLKFPAEQGTKSPFSRLRRDDSPEPPTDERATPPELQKKRLKFPCEAGKSPLLFPPKVGTRTGKRTILSSYLSPFIPSAIPYILIFNLLKYIFLPVIHSFSLSFPNYLQNKRQMVHYPFIMGVSIFCNKYLS
jgi:hypothetical protein